MAIEIERKFLLASDKWRKQVTESHQLQQGYLSRAENAAIRVRISGDNAKINIKSTADGINRLEFEYNIPLADALQIMDEISLRPFINKTRHLVSFGDHVWEIDEFYAENSGLIMAEIELTHEDEVFERPGWLGQEVSTNKRYFNSYLSEYPYTTW